MSTNSTQISQLFQDLLPLLLRQPTEIIIAVFQWLEVPDILNLRASCRQLHTVVHGLEKSLCATYRGWLKQKHAGVQLLASTKEPQNDLISYIGLQHRHSNIWQLSGVLSKHVISKLNFETASEKPTLTDLRLKKEGRLQHVLFPYLFMLNIFLENLGQVIVEADEAFAEWDDDDYVSAIDVFFLDQQLLIEGLCDSAASILGIDAALSILTGVCKANSMSLKTRSKTYPFASVKRILLARGLLPFATLLAADQDARRTALDQASESVLWRHRPELHGKALPTIHHLCISRWWIPEPTRRRPWTITNQFFNRQDVWHKAAFSVLRRVHGHKIDEQDNGTDEWIIRAIGEPNDIAYTLADWRVS